MKIVIASDSYKQSLSSLEVGHIIEKAIKDVNPKIETEMIGIADGGEGTVNVLNHLYQGTIHKLNVPNAYHELVESEYCIIGDMAIIEVANIIGLQNTPKRNPIEASSYGVGAMIKHCLDLKVKHIIIGLGGSATNDCGIGMMSALGMKINPWTRLDEINELDDSRIDPRIQDIKITVLSDVRNPLCGPQGASTVFGPQKGVKDVQYFDGIVDHIHQLMVKQNHNDYKFYQGAGAAGGIGFALMTYFNCEVISGIDFILDKSHFEDKIKDASYIITGEGCIDAQSSMGKAVSGIINKAKLYNIPVIGIGGIVKENPDGVKASFSIQMACHSIDEALDKSLATKQLTFTTRQIISLLDEI